MQSLTTKCMYMYWASCIHEAKKLEFIIFFSYLLFSRSRSHNCFYFSFVFFILCFIFQLVYSLNTVRDYGTILCSAENELGQQSQPCVFHLISAGKQKDSLFNNNIRMFMVQIYQTIYGKCFETQVCFETMFKKSCLHQRNLSL